MKTICTFISKAGLLAFTSIMIPNTLQALWNWLIPSLFGLPKIGFWQATGLMLLVLFISIPSMLYKKLLD